MLSKNITSLIASAALLLSPLAAAKTITVKHLLGETQVQTKPERVVVLGMDSLDVLEALEIEPVGVVKSPMPPYLNKYQSEQYEPVGSLFEPDFEAIYTLKPDLIIVSNRSSASLDELQKIAPTVLFMADAKSYWETTQDAWRMIGDIFEKQAQVEQIIADKQKQIDDIYNKVTADKANALVVMVSGGNLTTFGAQSRYGAIYSLFGFEESFANDKTYQHGDAISYEYISKVNPKYMLVLDRDAAIGQSTTTAKEHFDNPLINKLPVFKNNKISYLDAHAWYISASGIQATQKMIDDVQSVLN
ncbi:ABC transporter substrate-binding protein [Vibrio sp. 10N.261.55.A7]|uniref:siderophore ABC transporter substrate-binding protein n=1 Tax=Vibrio sp. 10N.261.55.A7 TaxID=1880851 RepID=UPI000C817885|nr:ABC transporter substrate-binding protein [Vibrio sp. 10N.261.55.A7]PMK03956.1 enterochelin ABC transporter substrate-binding protein [Vibrio sp. 10N.261.55.A7]